MKIVTTDEIQAAVAKLEKRHGEDVAILGRILLTLGRAMAAAQDGKPLECQALLSEAADAEYNLFLDCDSIGPLLDDEQDDAHLGAT
jgi:hypothetical protein